MGWTWEVSAWTKGDGGYEYVTVYAGESLVRAVFAMCKAKRSGVGCVKLEWRF